MLYNNLLYFLVGILAFSMAPSGGPPQLSGYVTLSLILISLLLFDYFLKAFFKKGRADDIQDYTRRERRASIGALILFQIFIFGLDLKYYISELVKDYVTDGVVDICGLICFVVLLAMVWRRAKPSYELTFQRSYSISRFVIFNIRLNLPIVLPWILLTLMYDLVEISKLEKLKDFVDSGWGSALFFGIFVLCFFILLPPLVRRLWGCKKMKDGPIREHLITFSKKHNFNAEIYLWPLFEGRVITAGVMGVVPGLRYILITPALLQTMTIEEVDSVMAHEIGHVKRFHLILYFLLFVSFAVASSFLAMPLFYYFFSRDIFYSFVNFTGASPDSVRTVFMAFAVILSFLFFIRFIFGFFMRNFERQADLQVFPMLGNATAIISAFEKIARLSGNIREKPSWHHFGIGERVEFLEKCEKDPVEIGNHHRKVYKSLAFYFLAFLTLLFCASKVPYNSYQDLYEVKFTKAILLFEAEKEEVPAEYLFQAGDYLQKLHLEKRAVVAYELAMEREPKHPVIQNNLAWLLLTSSDVSLRDPKRALELAKSAVDQHPVGTFLDTLASAWWANGNVEEALNVGKLALQADPEMSDYYIMQLQRYEQFSYHLQMKNKPGELPVGPKKHFEE